MTTTPRARPSSQPRRDPNARSVTFRMPLDIYSAISQYADAERRSLNAICCLLLEEALAARAEIERKQKAELAELRKLARQAKAANKAAAVTA